MARQSHRGRFEQSYGCVIQTLVVNAGYTVLYDLVARMTVVLSIVGKVDVVQRMTNQANRMNRGKYVREMKFVNNVTTCSALIWSGSQG